ncbi:VENN motif pre-toxin domain-containing protein [Kalamiella sp. sgz302252]|uniref:VENN motif pre-toxin domain-containing protein n=1 Tax=Pantoea sp. sgz302252 TaxID=3341827 RepID=UPI0036D3230D
MANANPGLEKIFDKEKEQRRVETVQAVVDIGLQVSDIVRTGGKIAATKSATEALNRAGTKELAAAKTEWQKANPDKTPAQDDIVQQLYQTAYNKAMLDSGKGTGGALQQGISAATAAVSALAGGNLSAAVAGGAAPYLAELIHKATTTKDANGKEVVNVEANLIAHAVLGAAVAQASGGSALAGASGGAAGEYIAQQLYPGVDRKDLSEEQRQTISALGTLAAGLAGGLAGDSAGSAVTGAQAGKNAVENNAFNLAGRTDKQVRDGIQRQADGVDLDQVYGNDQEKKDAYRKGREEGVKEGFKDGVVEVVQGTAESILHPIDAMSDLIEAVWNYDETYGAIKLTVTQWSELYEYALINDPELAGKMAGSLQGKIAGNIGTNIVVSGAAAKAIQKVAQMESGVKWLPVAHGKNHATIVKGDVHIPVDKIEVWLRGGSAGDVEALTSRLNKLKDERSASQKDFAKSGKAEEIIEIENNLQRIDRSRQMGRDLERVGIDNISNLNNSIIIDKLLSSAKNVTATNRKSSIVMTGSNGSVRITATWVVQADGKKRLSTVTTGVFNLK